MAVQKKFFIFKKTTFNVVLGFAGGANLASVVSIELDLADVGTNTVGNGVVGDARQLDVVDVAVAIGTDVSGCLMVTKKKTSIKKVFLDLKTAK